MRRTLAALAAVGSLAATAVACSGPHGPVGVHCGANELPEAVDPSPPTGMCSCQPATAELPANDVACNPATVGGDVLCFAYTSPKGAHDCTCVKYRCGASPGDPTVYCGYLPAMMDNGSPECADVATCVDFAGNCHCGTLYTCALPGGGTFGTAVTSCGSPESRALERTATVDAPIANSHVVADCRTP
jgi:hypothetical protein